MPGTSRQLAIPHGAQFPAQRLPGDDDAELLEDPLAKIDDPPPHDPMNGRKSPITRERWINEAWGGNPPKSWCIEREMEVPEALQDASEVEAEEQEEYAPPGKPWRSPPKVTE
jgi:hypothetical protein